MPSSSLGPCSHLPASARQCDRCVEELINVMDANNRQSALGVCSQLLTALNWTWEHIRVQDWLRRVGIAKTRKTYPTPRQIPDEVFVSLAKFLDLRLKCDRILQLLKWDWNHPEVREVEQRHQCVGQLPLKGYQELFQILDAAWFFEGGGF